jgi:hypothetical protein
MYTLYVCAIPSDYSCSYHTSAVLVFSHDEAVVIRVNKFDLPVCSDVTYSLFFIFFERVFSNYLIVMLTKGLFGLTKI